MNIVSTIGAILGIIGAGLFIRAITARFHFLPHSAWLIFGGVLLAVVVETFDLDTGIRASNFHDLVFYVLLPTLIFSAAYSLPLSKLRDHLPAITLLATVGLVLSTVLCGALLWLGIGHPGFPLFVGLLAGAMLSATDPVAVLAQMKKLRAPRDVSVLIEGESLFNDATAVVLFTLLLSLAGAMAQPDFSWANSFLLFIRVFFGGILLGVLIGIIGCFIERLLGEDARAGTIVTVFCAYASFYAAEHYLHVSGVMAVFSCAAWFSLRHHRPDSEVSHARVESFWQDLNDVFELAIFVIMGLVITIPLFTNGWKAMLIAIVAALVGRAVAVSGCCALANILPGAHPVNFRYQGMLFWGGLRGVIGIALAMSITAQVPAWHTLHSAVFGVVLFSLLVQAPTTPWLMRRLKIIPA